MILILIAIVVIILIFNPDSRGKGRRKAATKTKMSAKPVSPKNESEGKIPSSQTLGFLRLGLAVEVVLTLIYWQFPMYLSYINSLIENGGPGYLITIGWFFYLTVAFFFLFVALIQGLALTFRIISMSGQSDKIKLMIIPSCVLVGVQSAVYYFVLFTGKSFIIAEIVLGIVILINIICYLLINKEVQTKKAAD